MFVSYAALKDVGNQKKYLLDYFFNYPNGNEFEIVALKLVDIYSKEDRTLLAWIIYKELMKTKSTDFKTIYQIEELKKSFENLHRDSLLYYQVQPIQKSFFWRDTENQN